MHLLLESSLHKNQQLLAPMWVVNQHAKRCQSFLMLSEKFERNLQKYADERQNIENTCTDDNDDNDEKSLLEIWNATYHNTKKIVIRDSIDGLLRWIILGRVVGHIRDDFKIEDSCTLEYFRNVCESISDIQLQKILNKAVNDINTIYTNMDSIKKLLISLKTESVWNHLRILDFLFKKNELFTKVLSWNSIYPLLTGENIKSPSYISLEGCERCVNFENVNEVNDLVNNKGLRIRNRVNWIIPSSIYNTIKNNFSSCLEHEMPFTIVDKIVKGCAFKELMKTSFKNYIDSDRAIYDYRINIESYISTFNEDLGSMEKHSSSWDSFALLVLGGIEADRIERVQSDSVVESDSMDSNPLFCEKVDVIRNQ